MKLKFNKEQLELLNQIGFDFNVEKDLSDDEYFKIDEKVSDYFAYRGIENDEANKIGQICESIMDILGEQ
ncbi:hypothetical protein [Anaerovorax sp. IOR16]|uniref:hypothetical protein n=1 Tax=Anaerovorax sp. IOR16 TaxID=2773458 RepID=UPI0019D2D38F|nr:hypothetical protein [Anaerovorax sp. IOR16]